MSTRSWMGRGAVLVVGSVAIMGAGCASAARVPVRDPGVVVDDEVQLGYGTISRRNLTTSVSSVQLTREDASGTSAFAELLDGRIAGVQVTRTGLTDYSIRIRGGGEALIVVDGMVPAEGMPQRLILAAINPYDVARVDVLKDASASIYGWRGGNGVILITTRRGGR